MKPVYKRQDGTYEIEHNGNRYHATKTSAVTIGMVESYLLDHPEALITEPVPPPPTSEELAAREVAEAYAYLASTDWIVAKIGEAQIQGKPIAALLTKYSVELGNRSAARLVINEKE